MIDCADLMFFFFFNDTATTEIYTLSLHDALPICHQAVGRRGPTRRHDPDPLHRLRRSEEHTSELQSPCNLVCRLLLEKKKNYNPIARYSALLLSVELLTTSTTMLTSIPYARMPVT